MKASPRIERLEQRDLPSAFPTIVPGSVRADYQANQLARTVRVRLQNQQNSSQFFTPTPAIGLSPKFTLARRQVNRLVAQSQATGEPTTRTITLTDGPLPPVSIDVTFDPAAAGEDPSLTFTHVAGGNASRIGQSVTYTYHAYPPSSNSVIHVSMKKAWG